MPQPAMYLYMTAQKAVLTPDLLLLAGAEALAAATAAAKAAVEAPEPEEVPAAPEAGQSPDEQPAVADAEAPLLVVGQQEEDVVSLAGSCSCSPASGAC